jgi:transposase-like protein
MKGHGSKFARKREEAVAALLNSRNLDEAAKTVGVAPNTLLKWMKDREFAKDYREARRATVGHSIARIRQPASETEIASDIRN